MFRGILGACLAFLAACSPTVEGFNEENQAQSTCVSETPPYTGPAELYFRSNYGADMIRSGAVLRSPSSWASGDFLSVFREDKGFVFPSALTGLLSNPHRPDGTGTQCKLRGRWRFHWPHSCVHFGQLVARCRRRAAPATTPRSQCRFGHLHYQRTTRVHGRSPPCGGDGRCLRTQCHEPGGSPHCGKLPRQ